MPLKIIPKKVGSYKKKYRIKISKIKFKTNQTVRAIGKNKKEATAVKRIKTQK